MALVCSRGGEANDAAAVGTTLQQQQQTPISPE